VSLGFFELTGAVCQRAQISVRGDVAAINLKGALESCFGRSQVITLKCGNTFSDCRCRFILLLPDRRLKGA
jgi:hypothetical protein